MDMRFPVSLDRWLLAASLRGNSAPEKPLGVWRCALLARAATHYGVCMWTAAASAALFATTVVLAGVLPVTAAEPQRFAIAVQARKVDATQRTVRVTQGAAVELAFSTDEPVELHLHGYDKLVTAKPEAAGVLRFDAKLAGRFPIEAHRFGDGERRGRGHVVLLYLEVHPR